MKMEPFNGVFFGFMGGLLLVAVAIWLLLRKASERKKVIFLVTLCVINIAVFWVYKGFLSMDRQFLEVSDLAQFNWFNELPLQLCNINMFLIPIGVLARERGLLGFSFYAAPLGALMAMAFPEAAFSGYELFLPRMLGFYVTHGMLLVCGISLVTLGFYRPKFRDFPRVTLGVLLISLAAHGVNALLRATVCAHANYFFTYGADISILKLFWSWIPVPYVYLLPAIGILWVYMAVICGLFRLFGRQKGKKRQKEA